MSVRFTSQLQIDNLPDEQLDDQFEVIMPSFNLSELLEPETDGLPTVKSSKNSIKENISKLKQALTNFGANLGVNYNYRPIVEEISFGPRNFKTTTRRVRTGWYNVPEDIDNYHEVNITMFCSAGMLTQLYLEAWKRQIFNNVGEFYYGGNNYKKNIQVYVYGPGGNTVNMLTGNASPKFTFTLKGCFPKVQSDYKFKYSNDPERLRILATFCVDTVIFDTKEAKKAVQAELTTSPGSILDNILSNTLLETNTYSTHTTYTSTGKDFTQTATQQKETNILKK